MKVRCRCDKIFNVKIIRVDGKRTFRLPAHIPSRPVEKTWIKVIGEEHKRMADVECATPCKWSDAMVALV